MSDPIDTQALRHRFEVGSWTDQDVDGLLNEIHRLRDEQNDLILAAKSARSDHALHMRTCGEPAQTARLAQCERDRADARALASDLRGKLADRELLWQSRWHHAMYGRDKAESVLRQIRRLYDDLDAADITDFATAVGALLEPDTQPVADHPFNPFTPHGGPTRCNGQIIPCALPEQAHPTRRDWGGRIVPNNPVPIPARCATYDPASDDCACIPGIGLAPPAAPPVEDEDPDDPIHGEHPEARL